MFDRRQILDTVVQGSTVDLFHSNGIALAPVERIRAKAVADLPRRELTGLVTFSGRGFSGGLILVVPNLVFGLVKQDPTRPFSGSDWTREQTNQLLGRIKGRLVQFRVSLRSGLPTVPSEEALKRIAEQPATTYVYEFRTLRGLISVALFGDIDLGVFTYSNDVALPREGDIIIF